MDQRVLDNLRINTQNLVDKGLSDHESEFGRFKVGLVKSNIALKTREILLSIFNRIFEREILSINDLKTDLLQNAIEADFDTDLLGNVYDKIFLRVIEFIKQEPNYDLEVVRDLQFYSEEVKRSINDFAYYSGSTVVNILQNQSEYGVSNQVVSIVPLEIANGTVYTLFPKERYWETFFSQEKRTLPSIFRLTSTIIDYDDLIIYEGELYKLRPGSGAPTQAGFNPDNWVKFSPKRFNKKRSFKSTYKSKTRSILGRLAETGFDINSIISDSVVSEYSQDSFANPEEFVQSFGGAGKQVIEQARELALLAGSLGGFQGSFVGGLDYLAEFSEYFLAAAYGKDTPEVFNEDGRSLLGNFSSLLLLKTEEDRIPGLSFLERFSRLKSFNHNLKVFDKEKEFAAKERVTYNPLFRNFKDGVNNLYPKGGILTDAEKPPEVDLMLYALETIVSRAKVVGDLVLANINSLNSNGHVPGLEGLGSVSRQLLALQRIFPPSRVFLDTGNHPGPGLTGAFEFFLKSYRKLLAGWVNPTLPGRSFEFLKVWIEQINNGLEALVSTVDGIGIETGYIPNLSFKRLVVEDLSKLTDALRSIGLRDYEINEMLSVDSFSELVEKFAPISDSKDITSFFKAYELAQIIYQYGGESAINSYLSFLYSNNSINSLLNILEIASKNPSTTTNINLTKFPRLIGLLIGLTYAVNPAELEKFNKILGPNNLTLLESISFLFQQGEDTIIKSPESLELLSPVIEQIISSYVPGMETSSAVDYDVANSLVPIALKEWTELIGNNLGKISSKEIIAGLYDRSIGLTPKELITILNRPNSPNIFNGLIDGFEGGAVTSILRYSALTGLAVKLGGYKNSYQTDNFALDAEKTSSSPFISFIKETKQLIKAISVFKTIFNESLDYNFSYDPTLINLIQPLINSQNKKFDVIPLLLTEQATTSSVDQLNSIASEFEIQESPGIGNSRLPNRIPALNSITPEQAQLLLESTEVAARGTVVSAANYSLISKFIKFSQENKLSAGILNTEEQLAKTNSRRGVKDFSPATKFELDEGVDISRLITEEIISESDINNLRTASNRDDLSRLINQLLLEKGIINESESESLKITPESFDLFPFLRGLEYEVPKIYLDDELTLSSAGLGANYISTPSQVQTGENLPVFDPVSSCRRFGGADCEELYENVIDAICTTGINKSLAPEQYTKIPGVNLNSIIIDRPLGTFGDFKPFDPIIASSAFASPPSYYSLFSPMPIPGRRAEPIFRSEAIDADIKLFESGGGFVSEYNDSEFSLVEFIKAGLEKSGEFSCAGFESPFYYQLCMNIMKCKRFSPQAQEKDFLDFCPKTLSGGRLK